jgi:putative ABC transport system permease protein
VAYAATRISQVLAVFGALALALARVGLYGLVAYSVNQRRRELGVRMARGAGRGDVVRLVLRDGMSLVLVGILGGVGPSLLVSRALEGSFWFSET